MNNILLVKCHIRHKDAIKIVGCVGVDPMSYQEGGVS